ncbi:MAG: hypothetical protein H6981_01475 [Gammaproteobacteria bacterium]|nr:hypothetical protein [Gammaproteobacteria bacterium]MCP5135457.1 hypothetical protein [Gammaproteobacteria bacterium]
MSVGILLVAHEGLGQAFLANAKATWGVALPAPVAVFEVPRDRNVEISRKQLLSIVKSLDAGEGVLALVDVVGATPFNIVQALLGPQFRMVTGLNVAMLMRSLNYAHLPLPQVAVKAAEGAIREVAIYPEEPQ